MLVVIYLSFLYSLDLVIPGRHLVYTLKQLYWNPLCCSVVSHLRTWVLSTCECLPLSFRWITGMEKILGLFTVKRLIYIGVSLAIVALLQLQILNIIQEEEHWRWLVLKIVLMMYVWKETWTILRTSGCVGSRIFCLIKG